MTRHRYPRAVLVADYGRAALGLLLTLPPTLFARSAPIAAAIFAALALIFVLFALGTLRRQLVAVVVDEDGIAVSGGRSRRIAWDGLERLRLRWFAGRRNRAAGIMELALKGGGRRIAVDSRIDGFETIAAAAARAAARRHLALDDATVANLAALGITLDPRGQSSVVRSQ
jgi:hypothetical protein